MVAPPLHLMPHTASVQTPTGTARDGSRSYALGTDVRCRAVETVERATDQRVSSGTYGQTILTRLTLWCDPAATVETEARVTYRGRTSEVVSVTEGVHGDGTRIYTKALCV